MYEKPLEIAQEVFHEDVNERGDFNYKPRPSKMTDLQVIALAVSSESACIDRENLLFIKLHTDFKSRFPELIGQSRFNRRRRLLQPFIVDLTKRISMTIGVSSEINIVDSMPCPIVKNSRERSFKICKEDPINAPRKGFSAVDKRYYIGCKLHLLTNEHGVFQDMQITPANVHDINFLKNLALEEYCRDKIILGDLGYISKQVQTDLFTQYEIKLEVPYRSNQIDKTQKNPENGRKRRRIEVQFAQLCDHFRIKLNYATTFRGVLLRMASKLASIAVLQKVNIEKVRPYKPH